MVVKSPFVKLLMPGIAWDFFRYYYRKRRKGENFGTYMAAMRRAYRKWVAKL